MYEKGGIFMRKRKKDRNLLYHFKKRMRERFDIDIREDELQKLIADIKNNRSDCLWKQSNTKSLHKVSLRDKEIYVIYSKKYRMFMTALTKDMIEESLGKYFKEEDDDAE